MDNVLNLKFNNRLFHSNIKVNNISLVRLKANLVCWVFVRDKNK